jgi:hypothetical protein
MTDSSEPIVVNLGKRKNKHLKELHQGVGPAAEEVAEAVAQLREQLGTAAEGKTIVPVVVVYKKKRIKDPLWG